MKELSGRVAIVLNGSVFEVRDLGPRPVQVKDYVLPLVENKPELAEDEQWGTPFVTIDKDEVTFDYPVEPIPPPVKTDVELRIEALEANDAVLDTRLKAVEEKPITADEKDARIAELEALIAPLDGDGDGKPGGSLRA